MYNSCLVFFFLYKAINEKHCFINVSCEHLSKKYYFCNKDELVSIIPFISTQHKSNFSLKIEEKFLAYKYYSRKESSFD